MQNHGDVSKQTLGFTVSGGLFNNYANISVGSVLVKIVTKDGIAFKNTGNFVKLFVKDSEFSVSMEDAITSGSETTTINGIGWVRNMNLSKNTRTDNVIGDWKLEFDLGEMKKNSRLNTLLKDGFIDQEKIETIELTILYNGNSFTS